MADHLVTLNETRRIPIQRMMDVARKLGYPAPIIGEGGVQAAPDLLSAYYADIERNPLPSVFAVPGEPCPRNGGDGGGPTGPTGPTGADSIVPGPEGPTGPTGPTGGGGTTAPIMVENTVDLNTLVDAGIYYMPELQLTASILNYPPTSPVSGFVGAIMEVKASGTGLINQVMYWRDPPGATGNRAQQAYRSFTTEEGWSRWVYTVHDVVGEDWEFGTPLVYWASSYPGDESNSMPYWYFPPNAYEHAVLVGSELPSPSSSVSLGATSTYVERTLNHDEFVFSSFEPNLSGRLRIFWSDGSQPAPTFAFAFGTLMGALPPTPVGGDVWDVMLLGSLTVLDPSTAKWWVNLVKQEVQPTASAEVASLEERIAAIEEALDL